MSQPTVMIADDDSRLSKALSIWLGQANYDAVTVTDGFQALATAMEIHPDVLILDINMPTGSGFFIHTQLADHPQLSHIPVIYITGENAGSVDQRAHELNAFALLHKPFDIQLLLDTVQRAILSRAA